MRINKDEKFLSKKCEPILKEEWSNIKMKLFIAMKNTPNAVGIACNQVGIQKRGFAIRDKNSAGGNIKYFMNPTIEYYDEGGTIDSVEQCLSIPNKYHKVKRHKIVHVTDDINGKEMYLDYMAIVVQHEYDHMDGVLIKHKEVK